ncbi:hypothetical protein [Phytohabitans kaempferiae]|uniref:YbaB/EbfC DNA-binding family protein n=1 Tax=Phytohabitans kaempferiae TaxID=1620943 RepID=A0ABV6MG68_9ACTN
MTDHDRAGLLAELRALRIRAEALSDRFSASLDTRYQGVGNDSHGLARVTLDGQGRAVDVAISREWAAETDPPGLAAALVAAAEAAQVERLARWVGSGGRGAAREGTALGLTGSPPASSGPDLIRELLPLLAEAEGQLDEAADRLARHFTEPSTLASRGGEVTISTLGDRVTGMEFDSRWIGSARVDEIADQVCRSLQETYDRTWSNYGTLLPSALGGIVAFAADPEQMLRRLGLQA